jgi:uridine kinase
MPSGRLDAFVPPPPAGRRAVVLGELAAHLVELFPGDRVVVALDGLDGAGKTVLGRELHALVAPHREVHRASVDGFHRPRAQRYARGRTAETFYRDGHDHDAVRHRLVEPFLAGRPWVHAVHDVEREVVVDRAAEPSSGPDALLLVDGIFLHRHELVDLWDASVWVDVPFEVSVPRGNARFGEVGEGEADPASALNARYVGGQRLYLAEVGPAARATWVLDNTDLAAPVLTGSGGGPGRAARPTASG